MKFGVVFISVCEFGWRGEKVDIFEKPGEEREPKGDSLGIVHATCYLWRFHTWGGLLF